MSFLTLPSSQLDIVKRYRFHAAHRNPELQNKCSNIHGHTYQLECTFRTLSEQINPKSGITLEFGEIDRRIEAILSEYDHTLLLHNDDTLLKYLQQFPETLKIYTFSHPTSAEHLALHFLERFLDAGLPVLRICLMETPRSGVTVYNRMLHENTVSNISDVVDESESEASTPPQYGNDDIPDEPKKNIGERLAEVVAENIRSQEEKRLQAFYTRNIAYLVISALIASAITASFILSLPK